jgi:hypothetical protein
MRARNHGDDAEFRWARHVIHLDASILPYILHSIEGTALLLCANLVWSSESLFLPIILYEAEILDTLSEMDIPTSFRVKRVKDDTMTNQGK